MTSSGMVKSRIPGKQELPGIHCRGEAHGISQCCPNLTRNEEGEAGALFVFFAKIYHKSIG